jgi:hypothetical protein
MPTDKHLIQYLLLALALIAILFPFVWLAHNFVTQTLIAGTASAVFASWGILHHINEGRVQRTVIGEYILFGIVVFFIIFTILNLL